MPKPGFLVLQDGTVYEGELFGAEQRSYGEVVFNTSMTGYQEILTDPSYAGQMVMLTYPLVGNYGINPVDIESRRVQLRSFIVREWCPIPSHADSTMTLDDYLRDAGIPALAGIDTRALTRRLRHAGVMMGALSFDETPNEALERLKKLPDYGSADFVQEVTADAPFDWTDGSGDGQSGPHVVVLDEGLKYNILRILRGRGCRVTVVPASTSAEDITALNPDGLLLSPGPGDPVNLGYLADTVRHLIGHVPIMGICLGHQMVARALGAETYKLKFGHRGANHPVKDLQTGKVHITAQNHGYAVDGNSLPPGLEASHVNLNDDTVEGLRHRELPILTIQYHSEGSPGPQDNEYLFGEFLDMVRQSQASLGRSGV